MNWKLFLEGAAAAAVGGAVNHAALVPDNATPATTLKIVGVGAAIGFVGYLKNNARNGKPQPPQPQPQSDPPPDPGPQG